MTPHELALLMASRQRADWIRRQRLPASQLWVEVWRDPVIRQTRIGAAADPTQQAINQAKSAYDATVTMLIDGMWLPIDLMADKMIGTGVKLYRAGIAAELAGSAAGAASLNLLAEGMGRGVASLGAGAGQALKEITGGSPRDWAQDGELLIVLLAAGLFLTPGGQALLPAIGEGAAKLIRGL